MYYSKRKRRDDRYKIGKWMINEFNYTYAIHLHPKKRMSKLQLLKWKDRALKKMELYGAENIYWVIEKNKYDWGYHIHFLVKTFYSDDEEMDYRSIVAIELELPEYSSFNAERQEIEETPEVMGAYLVKQITPDSKWGKYVGDYNGEYGFETYDKKNIEDYIADSPKDIILNQKRTKMNMMLTSKLDRIMKKVNHLFSSHLADKRLMVLKIKMSVQATEKLKTLNKEIIKFRTSNGTVAKQTHREYWMELSYAGFRWIDLELDKDGGYVIQNLVIWSDSDVEDLSIIIDEISLRAKKYFSRDEIDVEVKDYGSLSFSETQKILKDISHLDLNVSDTGEPVVASHIDDFFSDNMYKAKEWGVLYGQAYSDIIKNKKAVTAE